MTKNVRRSMRITHHYLGFFLVGIMSIYALSGTLMIFRTTDLLKKERTIEKNWNQILHQGIWRNIWVSGDSKSLMKIVQTSILEEVPMIKILGWQNIQP